MSTITLKVDGLTCSNCVAHVTHAFDARDEVATTNVDLTAGGTSTVTLTVNADLADPTIAEILDNEGYSLRAAKRS